ncbi:F-box/LRR-repeat protein 20-like [Toxorhynchites rutilus septentrionalis]|uniref:F-box/LRR-repeat protein 20-like n=1 Tax=Toxorhynchites rutilus septentrionalis TaxID=329112 RepID=UPI002479E706|nr:F-box/LRR-repeat protein 20-like [Toxorhynchites rutilus septentrionalis]
MNLEELPPEIVWIILDKITELSDRKNASLVCKSWNSMLLNSSKSLRNVNFRICSKINNFGLIGPDEVFDQMCDVMFKSKRNYVHLEFFHINFEQSLAREFLFLTIMICCDSIESLRLTNCHGLCRNELWQILQLLPGLQSLVISGGIHFDELNKDTQIHKLRNLKCLTLDVGDDCRLYVDFISNTPNLKRFKVRTIYGCADLRDITTIRNLSHQLDTISFITNRCYNMSEFSEMHFSNLTNLELKVSGAVWPQLFRQMQMLRELKLEANIDDEVIAAICSASVRLRKLSLTCSGLVECKKFNMLNRLEALESLHMRGIHKFSWRHVSFTKLRHLHIDNVGTDFTNFLKEINSLRSFELHDAKLKNEQLIKITLNAPTVERLELAFCTKVSDRGFKHIADMINLTELRLWGIQVSKNINDRLACQRLKKIIFYFNDNIEDSTLHAIAQKLPSLDLFVLYDCYGISFQGVANLRKELPNCNVLELYRGDELPPALTAEEHIYYRNAEYPNGVLKQELPFHWY